MRRSQRRTILLTIFGTSLLMIISAWHARPNIGLASTLQSVTTYHNNNLRTGWNSNETLLTPTNVNSSTFGLLHSVALDEQVDSQPLVVPGVSITAGQHQGVHNVVYVATENNTIYAINASNGVVLLKSPQLGTPMASKTCNNNGQNIGITSTPVISIASKTIYAMAYSSVNGVPTYTLHALDLGNLQDKAKTVVSAFHALAGGGGTYVFNATVERQRPALLLANGNVYAAFGSFCDHKYSITRGWVLGWNAGTLAPLAHNQLTDTQASSQSSYYLSSVWMSGYGPAADAAGNVYFVTGNSDPVNNVYDGITDIQESVVKLAPNLSTVKSIFTPADEFMLDQKDADYAAGGVLLLPPQPGAIPNLAAAAGKEGTMFLLNQNSLGGFDPNDIGIVGKVSIGPCFCGQSYFNDGVGHIITSGGRILKLWTIQTSPTVALINAGSQKITTGQSPGFFTSISSSGPNNAIIWTVSRPVSSTNLALTLYAFRATPSNGTLPILYQATAGTWPSLQGNANLVPVVANGYVYVASNKQLSIFGLHGPGAVAATIKSELATQTVLARGEHEIFGTVTAIDGSQFTLRTRTGMLLQVDATTAIQDELSIDLLIGGPVDVQGTFDRNGTLQAAVIQRAKDPATWPLDI